MNRQETMTSWQRVTRAIEHQPTDRFPIDLGMHFSTGISAFAYYNLRKYLGFDTENIDLVDQVQMLARVDDDIIHRFHLDTKLLKPAFLKPKYWNVRENYCFKVPENMNPVQNEKGEWIVQNGEYQMRMPKGGFFFDGDWLSVSEYDGETALKLIGEQAEKIYKEEALFTCYMGFSGFFGGIDDACDMLTDPDLVIEKNEQILQGNIDQLQKLLKCAKGYIGCIEVNSDLGTQQGPMCTPASYEETVYPFMKRFCDYVHENTDYKIFLHSCGSIEPILPYIVDAGVDILNPVQISANHMEPDMLKEKYGEKLCFWGGGCNTQQVLNFGSVEDVKQNVRKLCEIFGKNSGFVFNQVHNVMGDIAPEKIVAMLDTAYEMSFQVK